jgi:hypothetical protein
MRLHLYRDESRSRHLDLIGQHWSVDLVTATAASILVLGFGRRRRGPVGPLTGGMYLAAPLSAGPRPPAARIRPNRPARRPSLAVREAGAERERGRERGGRKNSRSAWMCAGVRSVAIMPRAAMEPARRPYG